MQDKRKVRTHECRDQLETIVCGVLDNGAGLRTTWGHSGPIMIWKQTKKQKRLLT